MTFTPLSEEHVLAAAIWLRNDTRSAAESVWLVFSVRLRVMQLTVLLSQFCPSVCLSVRRVHCDKTKSWTADILIPREMAITLVF